MARGSPDIPFGSYLRGRRIAMGGMGEVFFAVRPGLGGFEKPVALKLLLPELSEEPNAVKMFLAEARLAARLSHPNVVQVLDVGVEQNRYYIAMEWVRGTALSTLIRAATEVSERFGEEELLTVAHGVLKALDAAHNHQDAQGPQEIIHRDVTPHNILVSSLGEVKLADFGIAKIRGTVTSSRTGHVRGKLEYLAPEQVLGRPADRRVDLYALAISLYQLATLRSPFRRDTDGAVVWAVTREELPSLAELRPDLSADLVQAIHRAASKAPDDRFASASDFAKALPKASAQGVERLARLVTTLCREALEVSLNESAPGQATKTLEGASGSTTSPLLQTETSAGTRRSRRWPWVGAAVGLLALVAGWRWVTDSHPTPAPAEPITPPPAVVAATEPAPAPLDAPIPRVLTPPSVRTEHPPSPAPTVQPAGEVVQAPAPTPDARPTSKGMRQPAYLALDATPWAEVSVDGKRIGQTPIARFPVVSKAVTVVLDCPETHRRVTRRLHLSPGRVAHLKVDLR